MEPKSLSENCLQILRSGRCYRFTFKVVDQYIKNIWCNKSRQGGIKTNTEKRGASTSQVLQAMGMQLFVDGCKNEDGTMNVALYESQLRVCMTFRPS